MGRTESPSTVQRVGDREYLDVRFGAERQYFDARFEGIRAELYGLAIQGGVSGRHRGAGGGRWSVIGGR